MCIALQKNTAVKSIEERRCALRGVVDYMRDLSDAADAQCRQGRQAANDKIKMRGTVNRCMEDYWVCRIGYKDAGQKPASNL